MSGSVKIDVLNGGPLIVDNLQKLTNSKGDQLDTDGKIALCRCGHSLKKPFCDGTHNKVGFTGERDTNVSLTEERPYGGEEITVHDNRTVCWHAKECVARLGSVFDKDASPWIVPDNAKAEEIIDTVKKCPSGALSYTFNDVHTRDFDRDPEINIALDGPYNVMGYIEINLPEGLQPPSREHYSLCRCGASKNKPYCDGSHNDINFSDEKN